jgi:hypothetical protein
MVEQHPEGRLIAALRPLDEVEHFITIREQQSLKRGATNRPLPSLNGVERAAGAGSCVCQRNGYLMALSTSGERC